MPEKSPFGFAHRLLHSVPGARAVKRLLFGAETTQWLRIVMERETERLVKQLGPERLRVMEISGDGWRQKAAFKAYKSLHYPEFDVCKDRLTEKYDLIIAEQVWEHLLWPARATRNVHEMLAEGGHFLVTTPFLVRIHEHPYDCTRWSETGMKYFLADNGFKLEGIKTGSWGNRSCVIGNLHSWRRYWPRLHSLKNDPVLPLVVWALAQR